MIRRDETYILYTFNSPHSTIKAQKLLRELLPKVIPVLREISKSCGMSIKLKFELLENSLKIMNESNILNWTLYKVIILNGERNIEELKSRKDN